MLKLKFILFYFNVIYFNKILMLYIFHVVASKYIYIYIYITKTDPKINVYIV
jgi:hypothetical protein